MWDSDDTLQKRERENALVSEPLFEVVRRGLRLTSPRGFCLNCGAENPDDDGHNPMCGVGEAFDALAQIQVLGDS